jgi:hypothetical protein
VDVLLTHKFVKGCTKKKILAALVAQYLKAAHDEVDDDNDDEEITTRFVDSWTLKE